MALKLAYGRRGSGKTAFCFDAIASGLKENKKIIYIVPEQFSLESERRIASKFFAAASSFVEVLSFERLAHQVFSKFGPLYKEYINDAGRQMLAQKALLKVEKKLTVLSDAAKQLDFANEILGTISEFKRHNVCDEKLTMIARQMENPILKFKLEDLSLIYQAYSSYLNKEWGDEEENLNILCARIEKFHLFTDTNFIIDQFTSFTPQEYKVIEMLLIKSMGITVSITSDSLERGSEEGIDVFSEPKDTAERLIRIALDNHVEILPNTYVGDCKKYSNSPELAHLEKNYFRYPGKVYDEPTKSIIIYQANHYYGEVEAAAKKIMKLCREQGMRYRDIVLVTRNDSVYFPLVKQVFHEYNIPCFINDKQPATKHPICRLVLSLFDVFIHNWNTENIIGYLKLGFSNLEQKDIYLLENYALASGLNHGQWMNEKSLTFLPQGFKSEDLDRINQIRTKVVVPLLSFRNQFSGRKSVREIITALYSYFIENGFNQKVQNIIGEFLEQGMPEESKEWKLAWDMLISTLDQMIEILGEDFITFERFCAVFTSGLSSFNLAQVPPMIDQVQLFALDGFQSQGPKVLMVLGTTEGVFPKGYNNEGILSDADRKTLKENGLELAHDTLTRQMAEQYLIYQCITASAENLFFFYPAADHEGKSCNPSPIVGRLQRLFPNLSQENNVYISESCEEIEGAMPLFWHTISELAKKQPLSTKWQTLHAWYQSNWKEQYGYAQGALTYSNQPRRLSQTSRDVLYGEVPFTSISRIEGYARCQFAHFIQYGLAVKPRKEYELQAVDVGSLMHGIIEQFSLHVQEIEGGWKELNQNYIESLVAEICDKTLKEYLGDAELGSGKFHQLSLKLKRIMSVTIWNIAQFYKNSNFEPLGYEMSFGTDGDLPPLEIELENGRKVRLVGKVDRVDVCRSETGNLISVVDYKSSGKDMDYSYIMAGMQVQLPVYVDAICKALSVKEKTSYIKAAMLYYKIDAPLIDAEQDIDEEAIWKATVKELKMRGIILGDEEKGQELSVVAAANAAISADKIDALCTFTMNKLKKVMEEMLSGNIRINPFRSGSQVACEYCPYKAVCQFDTDFAGNQYHSVRKIKKEEFFEYAGKMD